MDRHSVSIEAMRFALLMFALMTMVQAQTPGEKEYQTGRCPHTPALEGDPTSPYWLEGTIGQEPVRMVLERGGEVAVATFYYTADWVPVFLGGRWKEGDNIEVTATTEDDTETGRLEGRLTTSGFVGTWTQPGYNNAVPVRLKIVPQPKCDASGPWKLFDDARWPITFSYPASWRVTVQDDGDLTLTCPDPEQMAYMGFNIWLSQGRRVDPEASGFFQCVGQWRYGLGCDCENLGNCEAATVSHRKGMTILGGDEREWRVYCRNGGYVAQGDGHYHVLLIDDRWVQLYGMGPPSGLVERIVATGKRRR